MSRVTFGRISIKMLLDAQKELIANIEKYNDDILLHKIREATVNLAPEFDFILFYLIYIKKDRNALKLVLHMIFNKVIRRGLKYRSEIDKLREVPEYEVDV